MKNKEQTATLSDKFEARRKRVNDTCNEYTQAIAHTSFNQIEEDVRRFIKIILNKPQRITYKKWIKQNAGDKLVENKQ